MTSEAEDASPPSDAGQTTTSHQHAELSPTRAPSDDRALPPADSEARADSQGAGSGGVPSVDHDPVIIRPGETGAGKRRSRYVPSTGEYDGGQLLHNLLLFGRVLKGLGIPVTTTRMVEVGATLRWLNLARKADVQSAMRTMLVTRQADLALFDAGFTQFWRPPESGEWTTLDVRSMGETRRQKKLQFLPPLDASPDDATSGEPAPIDPKLIAIVPTYSDQELLRYKDFAEMTPQEIAQARVLMARLGWSLGQRTSRHEIPGKGGAIDPRAALRRNLRYGGDLIILPRRVHKIKPRPLVLLCDISGSMERYTRLLLHFMHTLAGTSGRVESFVFATRLTRLTRAIRQRSVDVALRDAGTLAKDWGGGTRTGDALHTFNFTWGRRVLHHGAVVLLITDGWDRGDPDLLRVEAARLQRNCARFIWLNPLLSSAQYQPLTRGAQSLLPAVDDFLPVSNLANLEMLARELSRVDWRRKERVGHSH